MGELIGDTCIPSTLIVPSGEDLENSASGVLWISGTLLYVGNGASGVAVGAQVE